MYQESYCKQKRMLRHIYSKSLNKLNTHVAKGMGTWWDDHGVEPVEHKFQRSDV